METSRQQVFIDYCSYLYSTGKTYRKIGVHLGIVLHFIENAPSLDTKGYKTYMRANAIKLSENIEYKGALCEFMAFIGQGFRCRKASRRCKPLERLSSMYDLLQEGGTLASITSKHWVLATEKKCETFRNWLKKVGAERYDILGGSFKESGTSIETVAVVIKKLGETKLICIFVAPDSRITRP